jgi:hypothetical protein
LGILDLNKFSQALRVRWQWLKWKDANKPWGRLPILQSRTEEALFRACTTITVGNGQATKFWHDRWIDGQSPKDHAPALYRLTRRKKITVAQGCNARKWLNGLQRMNSGEEINQLVLLWSLINQVQLSEQPDDIHWRFATDGKYTTKSAYEAQFLWQVKVESNCKFYSWLFLQNKLWIADRLNKYGGNANPVCQLCRSQPESLLHMVAQCSYSKTVWFILSNWLGTDLQNTPTTLFRHLQTWWRAMLTSGNNGKLDSTRAQARLQKMIHARF